MEVLTRQPRANVRIDSSEDPKTRAFELAQRGRMILDVATADLDQAERKLGPMHPTSWFFRNMLAEAQHSWDQLRIEIGAAAIKQGLAEPPVTVLNLGDDGHGNPRAILIPIEGKTYHTQRILGTSLAPIQWRLRRLNATADDGAYYVCKLADGGTQCDCADWTYRIYQTDRETPCKHLAALIALGWL